MKTSTLLVAAVTAAVASSAYAEFDLRGATGLFTPSFRNAANTTYFGWSNGTWDGNEDAVPPAPAIPDIINSTPSINPASLAGASIVQNNAFDIISGSNNVYGSVSTIDLTLNIPTAGTPSTGSTTIIIQAVGLSPAVFGGTAGDLGTFQFGDLAGVSPDTVVAFAAQGKTQVWAKYELPGNLATYAAAVTGFEFSAGSPISVTDLSVDTFWSANAGTFASDTAVPEPATLGLLASGAGLLLRRRR